MLLVTRYAAQLALCMAAAMVPSQMLGASAYAQAARMVPDLPCRHQRHVACLLFEASAVQAACTTRLCVLPSTVLGLQLWALQSNGDLQFMHMFAQTASPIQSISLHPSQQSLLMAVADGTISLWQLDTLGEVYRYKHEGPVHGLTFTDTDEFFFSSGRQASSAVVAFLRPACILAMCSSCAEQSHSQKCAV